MKIIDTGNDHATLEVAPGDCFRLAQACELASAAAQGCNVNWEATIRNREDLAQLWEVMAALFGALGTAAAATTYMSGRESFTLQGVKRDRLGELEERPESEKAA